jgi:hypothetical protein
VHRRADIVSACGKDESFQSATQGVMLRLPFRNPLAPRSGFCGSVQWLCQDMPESATACSCTGCWR